MSEKKITFKEFLEIEGDPGVRKIALEYSRSDDSITLEGLSKKYNMSNFTVRKLLDYAIINCVVSYQDALLMKEKAHRNQSQHIDDPNTVTPSDKHYEKVLRSRLEFIKLWDDSKVKVIVELYLTSPLDSAKKIAHSQGISKKELNVVLKKSIAFNIIDDNTTRELVNLSVAKAETPKKLSVWKDLNELIDVRKEYQFTTAKLAELYFKLDGFDGFAFEEEDHRLEFEKLKIQTEIEYYEKHLEEVIFKAYSLLE